MDRNISRSFTLYTHMALMVVRVVIMLVNRFVVDLGADRGFKTFRLVQVLVMRVVGLGHFRVSFIWLPSHILCLTVSKGFTVFRLCFGIRLGFGELGLATPLCLGAHHAPPLRPIPSIRPPMKIILLINLIKPCNFT